MAKKTILTIPAVGADSGDGTPLATAFQWINENFTELYDADASDVDSVNGQTGTVVLDTDDISEGATNLYNYNHTGEVTGATALTITDGAVTNAKMADNSVDSDQYVDGSIDTVHLANDVITGDKIGTQYKTGVVLSSGQNNVDFEAGQIFTKTLDDHTTLTFTNAITGDVKILYMAGNFDLALPNGQTISGAWVPNTTNVIQVLRTDSVYIYSISQLNS